MRVCVKEAVGLRGCSGIARNDKGEVVCGFLSQLRAGSSVNCEVWGILWAMKVAWDNGIRNLVVESE